MNNIDLLNRISQLARPSFGLTRDQSRSRRKRPVRGRTESMRRYSKMRLEADRMRREFWQEELALPSRPQTRAQCHSARGTDAGGRLNPCPFVSCKFNLYLDVMPNGSVHYNFPDLEPDEMAVSCALDVADLGGLTLEQVGALTNLTRERCRQIEHVAFDYVRRSVHLPVLQEYAEHAPRSARMPEAAE